MAGTLPTPPAVSTPLPRPVVLSRREKRGAHFHAQDDLPFKFWSNILRWWLPAHPPACLLTNVYVVPDRKSWHGEAVGSCHTRLGLQSIEAPPKTRACRHQPSIARLDFRRPDPHAPTK